jgi:MoaA/NifB/PqqE/SkfB family radical SAM enzyme
VLLGRELAPLLEPGPPLRERLGALGPPVEGTRLFLRRPALITAQRATRAPTFDHRLDRLLEELIALREEWRIANPLQQLVYWQQFCRNAETAIHACHRRGLPAPRVLTLEPRAGRKAREAVWIRPPAAREQQLPGRQVLTLLDRGFPAEEQSQPQAGQPRPRPDCTCSREPGELVFCVVNISNRCNLHCRICNTWRNVPRKAPIPPEHWIRFLEDLAELVSLPFPIQFTGGEPLVYPGLLDVLTRAAELGFEANVGTNGWALDEECAARLAAAGVRVVTLSLDGVQPATHDAIRGTPGSHARVMRAIEALAPHTERLAVGVNCCITARNLEELPALVEWVHAHPVVGSIQFQALMQAFGDPEPDPLWWRNPEKNALWPRDPEQVSRVLDRLIELKRAGVHIGNSYAQLEVWRCYYRDPRRFIKPEVCNIGTGAISVDWRGDVTICPHMESPGNVFREPIGEIWRSPLATYVRERILSCRENCHLLVNCCFEDHAADSTTVA